jgi:hypothetical protein
MNRRRTAKMGPGRVCETFSNITDAMPVWKECLEQICDDLGDLCYSRDCFRGYVALVKSNPKLIDGNDFHAWVARNYGCSALLGFRRMVDKASDVASVMKLLRSVKAHHHLVTRAWFLDAFAWNYRSREATDRRFDELCGAGEPYLLKPVVQGDIDELDRHADCLKRFTDKRLAHLSMEPVTDSPTFGAINDGIDSLEEVTRRYHLLLTGVAHGPLGGSVDIRDEKIWRFAWIE